MIAKTGIRPSRAFNLCALVLATGLSLSAGVARAEETSPAPADKVVAKVDGADITVADLEAAARALQEQLAQVPAEQRMDVVLNSVIEIKLFEKAAEKAGLDKDPAVARRLAVVRASALRNEYLLSKVTKVVTPEAIKKKYDEETAKFVPGDELHLYHILVKTEDEAKAIIAELDKGGDFEKIAKEKSSDPGSGAGGGDLGWVGKGKTVQPFEDAAFKLNVGEYSKTPVQTQFGYHVIKLTEKRKEVAPTFEERENAIRQQMLSEFLQGEVKALRDGAKIEIIADKPPADAAPAAPADAAPAAPPADAAPEQKPAP